MEYKKRILITGGAGFIGNHLVRLFVNKYPSYFIVNLDELTYAGNLENLRDVEDMPNYAFEKADILDTIKIRSILRQYKITDIIHLAAESHVDRSIENPLAFVQTNVIGTVNLLNEAKYFWGDNYTEGVFYHVSTDEVYGSLGDTGYFVEETAYDPRSPYSASKAASDHFVRAYFHTYGFPVKISNCSNNYGPNQFPEKLIPLMINNIIQGKELPVYGDGTNVRDWLWVKDHATAIDDVFHKGTLGETYNIGGENELQNIELVRMLCDLVDVELGKEKGTSQESIRFVTDRKGHDHRYAIDAKKIINELGWKPSLAPEEGFAKTVEWYLNNKEWLNNVTSGEYQNYYKKQYESK